MSLERSISDRDEMLCKYSIEFSIRLFLFFSRPFLSNLNERMQQTSHARRPRVISEPMINQIQSTLYTNCSYEEMTGEKLISSMSIQPQIDPLPTMFTYVPLQRNFLVR